MRRNRDLQSIILQTIALGGILAIGLVAPNVVGAMAQMGIIPGKRQKEVIDTARSRMVERGLLVSREGKVFLTLKGKKILRRWELQHYKLPKPKNWDHKWRLLIFDIPEKRRAQRAQIRQTLETVGFERLQDSVWLYPYPCEQLVALIKADFNIGKDLLYLTVERLENDLPWRRYFEF